MSDFDCPYCSWSMSREDINDQVHEDNHIGEWDVTCTNCKKIFELEAEPDILYWATPKEPTNDQP